jgi:hypothetical protein
VTETVEFADRRRGVRVFPRSWGKPPEDVEDRAAWALACIEQRQALGLDAHAEIATRRMTAGEARQQIADRVAATGPAVTVDGGRTTIVEVRS